MPNLLRMSTELSNRTNIFHLVCWYVETKLKVVRNPPQEDLAVI